MLPRIPQLDGEADSGYAVQAHPLDACGVSFSGPRPESPPALQHAATLTTMLKIRRKY